MTGRSWLVQSLVATLLLALFPAWAAAETAIEARLVQAHERGLEAYNNMEMEQAVEILEDAVELAEREGVTGRAPAQLHITLGTVLVLGLNRLADGRDHLLEARRLSTEVAPDEMLSTPLLAQLWQDVVAEVPAQSGGEGGDGGGEGGGDEPPPTFGEGRVVPLPVDEQLLDHAIPVYVELQQVSDVRRVLLAYRGADQRNFLSIEMEEFHEGYAGRIPCHRVRPPHVEYFVNVLNDRGEVVASAGSEEAPLMVAVREELRGREPHLPGASPEPHCSEDTRSNEQNEQALPGQRRRLLFIELGLGTGAGIPLASDQERNGCDTNGDGVEDRVDIISVNASLAWTELVVQTAFGGYLRPNLSLGLRGRIQFPGAVVPNTPIQGAILAELRWFPLVTSPVRLFLHFGLGAGAVVHPIALEGATNCGDRQEDGTVYYYREARYFIGQVGFGALFDVHPVVALYAQFSLSFLAPDVAIQGDLTFGLNFTIPRS